MSWIPPVRARLAERLIFNFRLHPDAMARFLPAPWLVPQVINGFGIASFCMLHLRGITVAPLPTSLGLVSMSCAPRYAVMDLSKSPPCPAVFVTERWSSSRFGSWFTSLGFSAPHPYAQTSWKTNGDCIQASAVNRNNEQIISVRVRHADSLNSQVFASAGDFASFVAAGVSSYGLSRYPGQLTKVDLHKADNTYVPLMVDELTGPIIHQWAQAGGVLDSAFTTSGGLYEWTYYGLANLARPVM